VTEVGVSFPAKLSGVCYECGLRINPGDPIARADAFRAWRHVTCPEEVDLTAPHPVCQTCWLTHPEGACDR
jgi:hypothetical protein